MKLFTRDLKNISVLKANMQIEIDLYMCQYDIIYVKTCGVVPYGIAHTKVINLLHTDTYISYTLCIQDKSFFNDFAHFLCFNFIILIQESRICLSIT